MATKTVVLVRHGQYHKGTEKEAERLTALGRKQARYAAQRLKEYKIDRLVRSTMPRALETAAIIKRRLNYRGPYPSCVQLRECVPGFPKSLRVKYGFTDRAKLAKDMAQGDRAFRKYFRATRRDSVEVLVCHGNLIRYLICRVLRIDPLIWRAMDIQQCAICVVEIKSKGNNRLRLISHNDVGHIPKAQRTFL